MKWLIETEDGMLRQVFHEETYRRFAELRQVIYGEVSETEDLVNETRTLRHPRVFQGGKPMTDSESETGLYVERSHVSHITWVPVTGHPDGPLHAGTLTEAKAYVQSLSSQPLRWHEDDTSGPTTRWVAWVVADD